DVCSSDLWWRGGAHRRLPGRSRPGSVAAAAIAVPTLVLVPLVVPAFPTSPAGTIRVGAVQGDGPAAYVDRAGPLAVLESQLAASDRKSVVQGRRAGDGRGHVRRARADERNAG